MKNKKEDNQVIFKKVTEIMNHQMANRKFLVIVHLKDGDVSITPKGKSYCTFAEAREIRKDFAGSKTSLVEVEEE